MAALLRAHPEGAKETNGDGHTPLDVFREFTEEGDDAVAALLAEAE